MNLEQAQRDLTQALAEIERTECGDVDAEYTVILELSAKLVFVKRRIQQALKCLEVA